MVVHSGAGEVEAVVSEDGEFEDLGFNFGLRVWREWKFRIEREWEFRIWEWNSGQVGKVKT